MFNLFTLQLKVTIKNEWSRSLISNINIRHLAVFFVSELKTKVNVISSEMFGKITNS